MAAPIAPDAPVTTTTFPARSVFMYEESFSRRLRELRGWASSLVMALQRLQRLFFCWPHSKTFRESRLRIFQIGDHSVEFVLCHDRRQIVLTADGVPPTDSYLFPICSGFFCRHGAQSSQLLLYRDRSFSKSRWNQRTVHTGVLGHPEGGSIDKFSLAFIGSAEASHVEVRAGCRLPRQFR